MKKKDLIKELSYIPDEAEVSVYVSDGVAFSHWIEIEEVKGHEIITKPLKKLQQDFE